VPPPENDNPTRRSSSAAGSSKPIFSLSTTLPFIGTLTGRLCTDAQPSSAALAAAAMTIVCTQRMKTTAPRGFLELQHILMQTGVT
jgi:hypothetical protein